VLEEPRLVTEEIAQFLKMPLNLDAMIAQVDQSLYRQRVVKPAPAK
jgi:hypothetical protein